MLVAGLLVLGLAACADSGSSPSPPSTSSTTRRQPNRSTTTSSTTLSSTTTSRPTTSTTAPPPSTTISSAPSPSNCGARAGAVYAAVQGGDLGPVPLIDYAITDCRIAESNQIWAAVTLQPKPGTAAVRLTVALQRIGSIWTVAAYGPGAVSCDAPAPAPAELRLGC